MTLLWDNRDTICLDHRITRQIDTRDHAQQTHSRHTAAAAVCIFSKATPTQARPRDCWTQTLSSKVRVPAMTYPDRSYGAVEGHGVGRFCNRHCDTSRSSTCNISNTSGNNKNISSSRRGIRSSSSDSSPIFTNPRQRDDDESRSTTTSRKRRAVFGAGTVIVLASMIVGYVLVSKVATPRRREEDEGDVLLVDRLDGVRADDAGDSFLTGREVAMKGEVRTTKKLPIYRVVLQEVFVEIFIYCACFFKMDLFSGDWRSGDDRRRDNPSVMFLVSTGKRSVVLD